MHTLQGTSRAAFLNKAIDSGIQMSKEPVLLEILVPNDSKMMRVNALLHLGGLIFVSFSVPQPSEFLGTLPRGKPTREAGGTFLQW